MSKVSIIIPVHNSAQVMRPTLESVISQTYKNIECLLVENNSSDNSFEICKEYQTKYPHIFRVFQTDGGKSGRARNKGLDESSGEYVTFLDSDDLLEPFAIEVLMDFALRIGASLTYGKIQVSLLDADGKTKSHYLQGDSEGLYLGGKRLDLSLVAPHGKLYKKEFLSQHKIRYLEGVMYDDLLMFFKVLTLCESIYVLPTIIPPIHHYIIHKDSSVSNYDKNLEDLFIVYQHMIEFFTELLKDPSRMEEVFLDKMVVQYLAGVSLLSYQKKYLEYMKKLLFGSINHAYCYSDNKKRTKKRYYQFVEEVFSKYSIQLIPFSRIFKYKWLPRVFHSRANLKGYIKYSLKNLVPPFLLKIKKKK